MSLLVVLVRFFKSIKNLFFLNVSVCVGRTLIDDSFKLNIIFISSFEGFFLFHPHREVPLSAATGIHRRTAVAGFRATGGCQGGLEDIF